MPIDARFGFFYSPPTMNRLGRTPRIAFLCALAFSAGAIVAAELPRHSSKVVVLRNGNVLEGVVRNENQRLVISDGNERVTRIPLNDVDFVCDDLNAAYRRKLSRLQDDNANQHLRLAQWCLRYDLAECAADRLLYLNRIAPHNPAVRALENRMRRMASLKATTTATAVSHTDPESPSSQAWNLEGLPAKTVPQFTRVVQPLLLNRCGQTTCHGSATKSDFRLTRGLRGNPSRELTWKNLAAVMNQVHSERFDESPLLLQARSIHGNSRMAPLEAHETRQFEHLYDWVRVATHAKPPSDKEIQDEADAAFDFARASMHQSQARTPSADALQKLYDDSGAMMPDNSTRTSVATQSDPFDPSAFNAEHVGNPSTSRD